VDVLNGTEMNHQAVAIREVDTRHFNLLSNTYIAWPESCSLGLKTMDRKSPFIIESYMLVRSALLMALASMFLWPTIRLSVSECCLQLPAENGPMG
jgi:hypothetical protein